MKTRADYKRLTENFSSKELLVSKDHPQLAQKLRPDYYHLSNLHMLCVTILQPVRTFFGVPLYPTSGYRDPPLNMAVGGHPESGHLEAKMADFTTPDVTMLPAMFEYIRDKLPFAWWQLIYYSERNFVHVGIPHLGAPSICEVRGWGNTKQFGGGRAYGTVDRTCAGASAGRACDGGSLGSRLVQRDRQHDAIDD
jgi:hypothetical protein